MKEAMSRLKAGKKFCVLLSVLFSVQVLFAQKTDLDIAKMLAQRAEQLADSNDLYNSVLMYSEALEHAQSETCGDKDFLHGLMYEYTVTLTYLGDYETAINVILQLYDLLKDDTNNVLLAQVAMQTGILYFFKNDYDEALENYYKARKIVEKLDNRVGMSIVYNNIGNIHQKRSEYDLAREMYDKSLDLQDAVKDSSIICNTLYNIGTCYEENNDVDMADDFYTRSYVIAKSINDVEVMSLCLLHRSYICMLRHDFHNAGVLLTESEKMTKQYQYKQVLLDVLRSQEKLAESQHNYQKALTYNKEYQALYDSIFNEDMNNQLNVLKIRNNVQRKEFEIASQKAVIKRQHEMELGLIIGLMICALIVVLLLIIWRLQRARNKDLIHLNHAKDHLFSIVSHDLKNPAMAQQNMLKLLVENFNNMESEDVLTYCKELLKSNSELVELLVDLLKWSKMEAHKLIFTPVEFNMKDVVDETVELAKERCQTKDITVVNNIPAATELYGDRNLIKTVIRNLLSNAIKFSYPGEKIFVDIVDEKNAALISVTDKGIVIDKKDMSKLFCSDKYISRAGTNGETGNGLGLLICKEIIKYHHGKIFAESNAAGTKFSFTINKIIHEKK